MRIFNRSLLLAGFAVLSFTLSACTGEDGKIESEARYPTGHDRGYGDNIYQEYDGIFGEDSLLSFGGDDNEDDRRRSGDSGLEINSFLWRASLDTVSFMPLASADPFGGVIITDWYQPPESDNERFKANVFILARELRTNAIKVKIFRQTKDGGSWKDAPANADTNEKMEDTILTRARALRVAQLGTLEIKE